MGLFYSKSAGGFFDDAIHDVIPADARALSAATHAALLEQQAMGRLITGDDSGDPIAVDPPPPSSGQLLTTLRNRRDGLLRESDHTQLLDFPMDASLRAAWATYRQALRDLPETTTDLAAVAWPEPPAA